MPNPKVNILLSSAAHARRILDKALDAASAESGETNEKCDLMIALITRARGLLVTLEEMPKDAFSPPQDPFEKNG